MRVDEYRELDAVAIDALVASGELDAHVVLDAAAQTFDRLNPAINAVVEWYDDPAPARVVGHDVGPALRGVPLLRKDYGSAEQGRLVEMGSRLAQGNRAATTAAFVETLWAAGAQIVGRSAVPELIQHGTTESASTGATRNPWDVSLSAGGSSGGAAAAVAAGIVPIAHASDCAGSIRIPASACGLVGLKPGRERVPWTATNDWNGLAQEFVVSRTVRDSRRCLDVLGVGDYSPVPDRMKLAVNVDHWAGATLDPAVGAATNTVAQALAAGGHHVDVVAQPVDYEQVIGTWTALFNRPALVDVQSLVASMGRTADDSTLEPMTLAAIQAASELSEADMAAALQARADVGASLERAMAGYDVLVTPTLGRATIPLGELAGYVESLDLYAERNDAVFPYNYVFNVTGWPSISVPGPVDAGSTPVGVQLSGRPGSEHQLLALAEQIERALPWPRAARLL